MNDEPNYFFKVYTDGGYAGMLVAAAQPVVQADTDDAIPCVADDMESPSTSEPVCLCDSKQLALGTGHETGCPYYKEHA